MSWFNKIISVIFILVGCQSFAQTIELNPGDQILVIESPTLVYCRGTQALFKMYCKCTVEGFSRQPTLQLILDKEGNTDVLATYASLDLCENAIRTNPACTK